MSYAPPGHETLAATGGAGLLGGTLTQSFTVAVLIMVVGVTLMAASRLFGRVAVEPVRTPNGTHRLRLTYNGRPIGMRKR